MRHLIYRLIYGQPLYRIIGYMVLLIIGWHYLKRCIADRMKKPKVWRKMNLVMAIFFVILIGVITLSSRGGSNSEVILIPFNSFIEAKTNIEMYRSMLMNVFLFFPLGLTMPYALEKFCKNRIFVTIFISFVLSAGIEYLQYYFKLGRTEVDDIICNTLGCAIGTLSYCLSEVIIYKRHIGCKKERDN